jgi:GT2 family glycosyltransferase
MTDPQRPRFSVVVPTYNRPEAVRRCLLALAQLDYPRDRFEVIVVDDGGTTPVDPVVDDVREHVAVSLLRQANAGPAAARNEGARRAAGDYLLFTDDDCEPDPGWLRALARRFDAEPDVMVGGRTVNALRENVYSEASHAILDLVYRHYNRDPRHARFVASNNLAVPADGFHDVGGFDTSYPSAGGEDRELCRRWIATGRRIVFDPEAVVLHAHALSTKKFFRQHFEYGRGAFRFHQGAGSNRAGALGELHFYAALPRLAARRLSGEAPIRRLSLSLLLGVWQLANAAGYGRERISAWRRARARTR